MDYTSGWIPSIDTALINLVIRNINEKDESEWSQNDVHAALELFVELEETNPKDPLKSMTLSMGKERFSQMVVNFSRTGCLTNYERKADLVTREKFWMYLRNFGFVESKASFPMIDKTELQNQRLGRKKDTRKRSVVIKNNEENVPPTEASRQRRGEQNVTETESVEDGITKDQPIRGVFSTPKRAILKERNLQDLCSEREQVKKTNPAEERPDEVRSEDKDTSEALAISPPFEREEEIVSGVLALPQVMLLFSHHSHSVVI